MKLSLSLCLVTLFSTGCGALLQGMGDEPLPAIESKVLSDTSFDKSVEADAVHIFRRREELPRGLFFYQDRKDGQTRTKLFASAEYPSATQPHVVLAAMAVNGAVRSRQKRALEAEYRARASEMGANALYFASNPSVVFAIRLGTGNAERSGPSPDKMEKNERKSLQGYKPLGAPRILELGQAEFVLPTKSARCYAMTVVMEEGASFSQDASHSLYIALKSGDRLLGNRSLKGPTEEIENSDGLEILAPRHGAFLHMRSFSNKLGCTNADTSAQIRFWTMGNTSNIGTGSLRVQLFEKKISKSKLATMLKESDARWARARLEAEQERARQDREDLARLKREQQAQAARDSRQAERARSAPSPAASTFFSMSLKSECPHTVKLFLGKKPRFGSGETRTISSNSINSFSGTAGKMFWIVDASGNGVSSYVASAGSQSIK
ncbi:MAG: hypothetical protein JKY56_04935, partial [Kofleriaceae bacterium]|nr:hypothetical protein [Kofleriaceae bacterium]